MKNAFEVARCVFLFICIIRVTFAASINVDEDKPETDNVIKPAEVLDVDAFLERFGYLEKPFDGSVQHSHESRHRAIRNHQKFNGLPVTGKLDEVTLQNMKKPRCGVPDVTPEPRNGGSRDAETLIGIPRNLLSISQQYIEEGNKWDKDVITWKLSSFSQKLPRSSQRLAISGAFDRWAKVSSFIFQETYENADIDIKFARGEYGDPNGNSFDGRGRILAHAFLPKIGDIYFDADENWVYHQDTGTELETVAAHEIGHALGLGHSNNPSALMAPHYHGYDPSLHQADIEEIQYIYGLPYNTLPTTVKPAITTMVPITAATTPVSSDVCGIKFDAIILGPSDATFVFREDNIYELNDNGIVPGYPKKISDVFPGAPSYIGAAAYVKSTDRTYIFKGQRVWRFTNFELDAGYDGKYINNISEDLCPRAAMVWMGRVFLFGRSTFWEYNQYKDEFILSGFPLPTWHGIPSEPEAIVNWKDGNAYFFKGDKYYKMDMYYRSVRTAPKDKAPAWLGGICGSAPK